MQDFLIDLLSSDLKEGVSITPLKKTINFGGAYYNPSDGAILRGGSNRTLWISFDMSFVNIKTNKKCKMELFLLPKGITRIKQDWERFNYKDVTTFKFVLEDDFNVGSLVFYTPVESVYYRGGTFRNNIIRFNVHKKSISDYPSNQFILLNELFDVLCPLSQNQCVDVIYPKDVHAERNRYTVVEERSCEYADYNTIVVGNKSNYFDLLLRGKTYSRIMCRPIEGQESFFICTPGLEKISRYKVLPSRSDICISFPHIDVKKWQCNFKKTAFFRKDILCIKRCNSVATLILDPSKKLLLVE